MKFNEWMKKVEDLQEKIQDIALVPISESIFVNGKTVAITLEKGKLHTEVGGTACGIKYLRHEYTHAKEEFDDLLEALENSAREILANSNEILLAVTEEEVPAAVIARMSGKQVNGDTTELLEKMVERKVEFLMKKVGKITTFRSFDYQVVVGNQTLYLERAHIFPKFAWHSIQADQNGIRSGNVRDNLKFLGKFEAISGVVERFCILMDAFKSLES